MRTIALIAILALASCDSPEQTQARQEAFESRAQRMIDSAARVCRDGVQYLVFAPSEGGRYGPFAVPHIQRDGTKAITCTRA